MSRAPMNGMNGYRSYNNPASTPQTVPTGYTNGRAPSQPPAQHDVAPALSRADRFEDEKKRIVDSCFAKTDETGQLQESYITHIRITEDAIYPSSPPPPDSGQDNKKPRIIIIAVRNTGRVRMHKARENNNGSFSIGKTWNMEDLSSIESFSSIPTAPRDDREAQYRTWAGSVGFICTITKPYYWQAGTSKEKDFFIASAVKIFKKYTKGQVPDLRGFDDKERAAILGSAPSSTPQSQSQSPAPLASTGRRPSNASTVPTSLQPPVAREQSRDASRYRGSPGFPDNDPRAPSVTPPTNRVQSPPYSVTATPPRQQQLSTLRQYSSSDRLRSESRGPRPVDAGPVLSGYGRPPVNGALDPPAPIRQNDRSDSPTIASRNRSPPRQRSMQDMSNRYENDFNGSPSGPALFASTRQRLQQQTQQTPNGTAPRKASQSNLSTSYSSLDLAQKHNAPQVSPIATSTQTVQKATPTKTPVTATSDGLDLTDAATIGAITSFWAQPSNETLNTKAMDPVSPLAPERSRRRPTIESKPSTSSLDLRPAPLSQARKPSTAAPPLQVSTSRDYPPPVTQVPSEIKPLSVQNKQESSNSIAALAARTQALNALSAPGDVAAKSEPAAQEEADEQFRPGLGPMVKKKVIANRILKAANTVNAFKPRPGGAAEKILKARAERDAMLEPDGISAVVPRPEIKPVDPAPVQPVITDLPRVEVVPSTPAPIIEPPRRAEARKSVQLTDHAPQASLQPEPIEEQPMEDFPQLQPKVKRRSAINESYLTELGIDKSLLQGKGLEFEALLDEFGWRGDGLRTKDIAELEQEVKRELGRVEAGSWLSNNDASREEKVAHVEALLDKAIAECDDLDGLLTLYSVELGSLNDDIAFIEAQSQGLQVQSANQKVLQSELKNILETMSLSRSVMDPLRQGDMTRPDRLEEVEHSLVKLYDALVTMDPSMRSTNSRPISRGDAGEIELSRMAALREKKEVYTRESTAFCQRLMQHLDFTFKSTLDGGRVQVMRPVSGGEEINRLNKDAFALARSGLWMYSPVILFTKEANPPAWQTIIRMYYTRASSLYVDAFKENLQSWKQSARKPAAEDAELLFTHQEKDSAEGVIGLTNTARKMTVKRSATLAKTLRNASGDKHVGGGGRNTGALIASEVFAAVLDEMAPLINQEQNFIVDMFHVTSTETADFLETVHAAPPENRQGTNLLAPKPIEPNREMSRRVHGIMDEIFAFFSQDLLSLLEWVVAGDPIQGVGIMAALSKHAFYLEGTSQEFLLDMLDHLRSKLRVLWTRFVDEQIRAIEDTKVKIHKRKGVISFMKLFPPFSTAVENVFAAVARNDYDGPADCMVEVRRAVDAAYAKINQAMFDSLKVIAKEGPGAMAAASTAVKQGGADDPEDKEMLNYYILIIENMNHYIEEVDDGGREGVLAEWRGRAMMERSEALDAYISRVIRRPLGKLLDFVESLESSMMSSGNQPSVIVAPPSYSRKAARGILAQFDSKEVRRGIETLRRRVEKHFVDGDEHALARGLVAFVTKECERSYEKAMDRTEKLVGIVYPPAEGEKVVELEFTSEDVRRGFRK